MTAFIGYDNIIESQTSITNDESADYPLSNALNWNLYDVWKPGVSGVSNVDFTLAASDSADYIAIYGHNIEGVTISLARYTGFSHNTFHSFVAGSGTIFERFSSVTDDRWRITFSGLTTSSYITCIAMGSALQLNPLRTPFAPPPLADNAEIINNISVENILLGRITRKAPFELRIDQTIVNPDWVDANAKDLIEHVNAKPFFFTWDINRDDACICWTDRPVEPPQYRRYGYQDFSIRCWGYR